MKRLLVTAALPYSNGRPHVGHIAGAYLPSDIYVRYQRLTGREVRFVCGSDDYGVANIIAGEKEGKTPAEISEFYNEKQKIAFKGLNIHFDVYSSTSRNPYHKEVSQGFFKNLYEKDFFEKQVGRQFYDEEREMFLPDRFVKGTCGFCDTPDQNGDQCENCGKVLDVDSLKDARSAFTDKPAVVRETVHWFIDLSRFQDDVKNWVDRSVLRDQTRKFVSGLLSAGLVKRSMTRDIDWGIPVPIDDPDAAGKVLYVWFDAPIGYISNTLELCEETDGDKERYVDWWKSEDCELLHFIGEDNTIFHCVIWIAMLHAEGSFQLPKGVIVNQFVNIQFPDKEAEKISKSRGNAVWIEDYLSQGGPVDTLRYYLTAIAPEKARTVYKPDDLVQRNNADLANTIGNFVNRIVSFTRKYCDGKVPAYPTEKLSQVDEDFRANLQQAHQQVTASLDEFSFKSAQEVVMEFARACNRYVDEKAPWKTRKDDMELTACTLAVALEGIKFLGVALRPFLPDTSDKILQMLSCSIDGIAWSDALVAPESGTSLAEPIILFEKMELTDWVPETE